MARSSGSRFATAVLFAVLGVVGCASRQDAPPSPTLQTAQNLRGKWKLQSFSSQKPLEQPFQALLDAQLRALLLEFKGDEYFATGPGVSLHGRFEITSAAGDQFSARLFDPDGVAYPISARFRGAELDFQSHNERWRGSGVLARAGQ